MKEPLDPLVAAYRDKLVAEEREAKLAAAEAVVEATQAFKESWDAYNELTASKPNISFDEARAAHAVSMEKYQRLTVALANYHKATGPQAENEEDDEGG